ncbi:Uncharacterised protein [Candidatus Burarchaeum australiense]|nr:Uncharacterised protein [Candidatus Burarchaeum australiense]
MKTKILFLGAIVLLLLSGCAAPPRPEQNLSINTTQNLTQNLTPSPNVSCGNETCFIAAANNCKAMDLTLTDDAGTFSYSSTSACVFTKTLVSLGANESQDMKQLLEGKNMTCIYEQGKFDPRLVTSLLYGIEYCDGELKDGLGSLAVFS